MNRYELALDKVNEAFSSIADYRAEIAALDLSTRWQSRESRDSAGGGGV